jgi:hypothetical protein
MKKIIITVIIIAVLVGLFILIGNPITYLKVKYYAYKLNHTEINNTWDKEAVMQLGKTLSGLGKQGIRELISGILSDDEWVRIVCILSIVGLPDSGQHKILDFADNPDDKYLWIGETKNPQDRKYIADDLMRWLADVKDESLIKPGENK